MPRPWTPAETARYESVRRDLRRRMLCLDRAALRPVTQAEVHRALVSAGYSRSYRYVRAVLSGAKRSRPCLRECSAAVDAVRAARARTLPDWL